MALSYNDMMFRNLFLGFIRIHILYHASREPVFGLNLIKELARHGYRMSPGTLYPMLHQMESNGFLSSDRVLSGGKMRRYYRITEKGKQGLMEAYGKVEELFGELHE